MAASRSGGQPARIAAFIGARVFADGGRYWTDSSLVYELAELARQYDEFYLHCFVIEGERARDELRLSPGVRLVQLGPVRSGHDLYLHPARLLRRIAASASGHRFTRAVLAEPSLVSLLALLVCSLHRIRCLALIRGDPAVGGVAYRHGRGLGAVTGRALRWLRVLVLRVLARTVPLVADSDVVAARLTAKGANVHVLPAASIAAADIEPPGPGWQGYEPLRVLFVGRLEPVKDLETMLEALWLAASTGRRFQLRLVGSGDSDYLALLRARVRELGLGQSVEFAGPVAHGTELYRQYQQAHLLALSSRSEGIPKVVIEAMAHGLPVVATRVGGLPSVVTPEAGILVPPGRPDALAKALITIHDSPALAQSMTAASRAAAEGLLAGTISGRLATLAATTARPPSLRKRGRPTFRSRGSRERPRGSRERPRGSRERPRKSAGDGRSPMLSSARAAADAAPLPVIRPRPSIPGTRPRLAGLRVLLPGSVANLTAQGVLVIVGLFTGLVAARVLGPAGRGELSFLVLVPGTLTIAGSLGAEYGTYYFWHADGGMLRPGLLATAALVTTVSGAIFGVVGYVAVSVIEPQAGPLPALLAAAGTPLGIANAILTTALMAEHRVLAYNVSRLAGPLAYGCTVAGLWTSGSLTVTLAFQAWFASMVLTVAVDVVLVARTGTRAPRWVPDVARRSVGYGLRSYVGTLAQYGTLRLDQVFLVAIAGNGAYGLYYAAVSLAEAVLQISDNIGSAMMAQLGGRARVEQRRLAALTIALAGLGTAAAAALLMVYGAQVITLLLGRSYLPGLSALRILLIGSVLLAIARMMNGYFIAVGEARVFARASVAGLSVITVAAVLLIPRFRADGAAVASTLAYAVILAWLTRVFRAEHGCAPASAGPGGPGPLAESGGPG